MQQEPEMTLSQTLKHATAEVHRLAESRPLQRQLIRGALPIDLLAAYLGQLRLIHSALENLFDDNPGIAETIRWSDAFRHSRRLDADLAALGAPSDALLPTTATRNLLNEIDSTVSREPASLLGFFYVLEGSMNGNRFIVRALRKATTETNCEFTYFDPYCEAQPAEWAAFKASLDAFQIEPDQQPIVVDAASCMFDALMRIGDELKSEKESGTGPEIVVPHAAEEVAVRE